MTDRRSRFNDYSAPTACVAWIATMVQWAEAEGVGYPERAEVVADDLVESVEDTRPPTGSYDSCDYPSMNPAVDCD